MLIDGRAKFLLFLTTLAFSLVCVYTMQHALWAGILRRICLLAFRHRVFRLGGPAPSSDSRTLAGDK